MLYNISRRLYDGMFTIIILKFELPFIFIGFNLST